MQNIRLGSEHITEAEARKAARYVGANQFIEKLPLGYDQTILERGSNLSSGQRQLISFARALAHDPSVLILDEATSNIDTESELLIQEAIRKLMADRTSIVIAHRLSTIRNVNRIIVMHKGAIHEIGSHNELIANRDLYYKLYELQYKDQERTTTARQLSST